jgi:WXG100 family type VII secretion target
MIISGSVALDRAAHAAASSDLAARLAGLDERRRAAELAVDLLLSSWRGDAASHFAARWQEWDAGARDVIDALSALLGAIDLARADIDEADSTSAQAADRLLGRLR